MNSTNRALNRLVILVVGVLLTALGAAALLGLLVPTVHGDWRSITGVVQATVSGWLGATPIGDGSASWLLIAAAALLVIAILLLVAFILRQGRGHTRRLLTEPSTEHGRTVVEAAVAEQLLHDALSARTEFVSNHVSTYRIGQASALKLSVTCRRGVSPRDAISIADGAIRSLDVLLGARLPALIQVSGGFRARTSASTRLQ
ncbi:hypothetical protein [Naasia lichenicola]|uniref:Alkaline shock response membrane anchor protein AmaP n=1 Tax=Naasia lichenicola TaxID=2565933 RepID=A0A4S4FJI1_9MICO|nr:hypothetical protein [Naasia lichenicola]THG30012.1 hypothetical protein E6C64_15335 [Naasia lichenicola]